MGNKQKGNITFNDLSELIVKAINDEPFFNKETLIPKVRAIMKGFHLNMNPTNYNKIESPSESARRLRAIEVNYQEKLFWKTKCTELCKDNIKQLYAELDAYILSKGLNN
jgi:hypothetical protein